MLGELGLLDGAGDMETSTCKHIEGVSMKKKRKIPERPGCVGLGGAGEVVL